MRELTVNFRSSREVGQRAGELCARHAPTRHPLPGVWSSGAEQIWVQQEPSVAGLLSSIPLSRDVAVVVPVGMRQECIDAVGDRATVVSALESKGLEFDQVVLAWPELIVLEGASQLLVAATRASRVLHVISALPAP